MVRLQSSPMCLKQNINKRRTGIEKKKREEKARCKEGEMKAKAIGKGEEATGLGEGTAKWGNRNGAKGQTKG